MTNQKYQVAFRQGGPERFRWSKVLHQYASKKEANEHAGALMAHGFWSVVLPWEAGLPETYSPDQSVEDVITREDGWSSMMNKTEEN